MLCLYFSKVSISGGGGLVEFAYLLYLAYNEELVVLILWLWAIAYFSRQIEGISLWGYSGSLVYRMMGGSDGYWIWIISFLVYLGLIVLTLPAGGGDSWESGDAFMICGLPPSCLQFFWVYLICLILLDFFIIFMRFRFRLNSSSYQYCWLIARIRQNRTSKFTLSRVAGRDRDGSFVWGYSGRGLFGGYCRDCYEDD